MYCRNCGNIVAGNATVCQSCGFDPYDGSNYCPNCGHFCIPGDIECIQCKAPLLSSRPSRPSPQPEPQQQKTVTTNVGPKFLSDNQRYCRNCGLVIPADARNCPFCDSAAGSNYCQKCGSGTTSADTVCSVCSSPLTVRAGANYIPSPPPVSQQRTTSSSSNQRSPYTPPSSSNYGYRNDSGEIETCDWLITLLLCFFLGYLGIHRFYTKNYVAGVLQLISGGGCGVWWIIDLVMILTDSYTDGNGNKLRRTF